VATVTTDETGSAVIENLPLGKYRVEEKKTPEGYHASGFCILFFHGDAYLLAFIGKCHFFVYNRGILSGIGKGYLFSGAVFGLYNKNEIKSGDNVIVKADTLLQEITSDEKGQALVVGWFFLIDFSLMVWMSCP